MRVPCPNFVRDEIFDRKNWKLLETASDKDKKNYNLFEDMLNGKYGTDTQNNAIMIKEYYVRTARINEIKDELSKEYNLKNDWIIKHNSLVFNEKLNDYEEVEYPRQSYIDSLLNEWKLIKDSISEDCMVVNNDSILDFLKSEWIEPSITEDRCRLKEGAPQEVIDAYNRFYSYRDEVIKQTELAGIELEIEYTKKRIREIFVERGKLISPYQKEFIDMTKQIEELEKEWKRLEVERDKLK